MNRDQALEGATHWNSQRLRDRNVLVVVVAHGNCSVDVGGIVLVLVLYI